MPGIACVDILVSHEYRKAFSARRGSSTQIGQKLIRVFFTIFAVYLDHGIVHRVLL